MPSNRSKLKILLLNDYATPTGGAEVLLLNLRAELRRCGHDARLLASSAHAPGAASQADYECHGSLSSARILWQTANPSAVRHLARVLTEFKPDVVHTGLFLTQLSPLILPLVRSVPSLYHAMWYRAVCPLGTKLLPDGTACTARAGVVCRRRRCISWCDTGPMLVQQTLWRHWRSAFTRIVATSHTVAAALRAEGLPVGDAILSGVAERATRSALSPQPSIGFAGRLVREKGVDVLLRALARVAARIPTARLEIVGDGPERSHLQDLAHELRLGDHVSWRGQLARAETERALDPVWLQAVPSRWAEPFGLVAVEAMMRGCAVVASRAGGLVECVSDGETGVLVPPDDPTSLADTLVRLLSDRAAVERMGQAGRARAQREFTLQACAGRFVESYWRVIAEFGSGRRG